jgi:V8-like Glu-specific endopeptidase
MAYNTSTYPYDAIVMITDDINGESWQGSGVLISPDEVLTASHLVFIQGGATATHIVVTPAYNGGISPYGSASGTTIHYNQVEDAGESLTNQQSQYDYAVIHLAQPIAAVGTMGLQANFSGGTVNVSGYPASAGGTQITSAQVVTANPDYTLLDGTSLGSGSSGGPVWVDGKNGPQVVGLISSQSSDSVGYNSMITTAAYNQIEQWVADDNGGATVPPPIISVSPSGPNGSVWQNDDGLIGVWQDSSAGVSGISNPGTSWAAVASGDFYLGSQDALVENSSGALAIWAAQGTVPAGGQNIAADPGLSWYVRGTGDFNGDKLSDIVWQNDNGAAAIWEMNGTSIAGGGTIGSNPGPSWLVKGSADFFNDGNSDLLFQNGTGEVAIWDMHGASIVRGGTVAANPGPDWRAVGTGDFYGDGHSDILWQADSGEVAVWNMNGTGILQGGMVADPGPTWHVVGTGDYNADGKTDILLQNEDGAVAVWLMDGTAAVGGGAEPYVGLQWNVIGSDRMQFIDSVLPGETLAATPTSPDEFIFTNPATGPHTITGFNPVQDIIELSDVHFASFAAVQAATTATSGGAMITLDQSTTLLLQGVSTAALHESNFALA